MRSFFQSHSKTIFISLFCGIIIFYLSPVLTYIRVKFVEFLLSTSESFSNMYFQSIAKNSPFVFDYFNSYILIFGSMLFFLFRLEQLKYRRDNLKVRVKSNFDRIQNLKKELKGENKIDHKQSLSHQLEELSKMESTITETANELESRVFSLRAPIIFAYVISLILVSKHIYSTSISEENLSFRNRLIVLLPIIGEQNVNELKSHWAQMKNAKDYDYVIRKIEEFENSTTK